MRRRDARALQIVIPVSMAMLLYAVAFGWPDGRPAREELPLSTEHVFPREEVEEEPADREVDELVAQIVMCESSGRHEGHWGDLDYPHPAYGIAQFQKRTFYWLAEKAGMVDARWKSRGHQLELLRWAAENDYLYLWSCYEKIAKREELEADG